MAAAGGPALGPSHVLFTLQRPSSLNVKWDLYLYLCLYLCLYLYLYLYLYEYLYLYLYLYL